MDFTIFSSRLHDLMATRGLNMKELAGKTGMTCATISRYLSCDRTPDIRGIAKIAEYFDVSMDWLLGFDRDKYAPLPRDHQELIDLYSIATNDDRRVIQAVLNKYRKQEQ